MYEQRGGSSTLGMTLVELMIVVAIIGLLAVLAIPNFVRSQAKARQSEAKTNLAGIFAAQTSYYAERATVAASFGETAWRPAGGSKYGYAMWESVEGDAGFHATARAVIAGCDEPHPGGAHANFTACAAGNVDNDPAADRWYINDDKILDAIHDDV
jgi:type IV pilus assembly protein PilA